MTIRADSAFQWVKTLIAKVQFASQAQHAMLRKALIGLVGAESREELEQIEMAIRVMPVPDIDRMNTINAIQALLQTSSC